VLYSPPTILNVNTRLKIMRTFLLFHPPNTKLLVEFVCCLIFGNGKLDAKCSAGQQGRNSVQGIQFS